MAALLADHVAAPLAGHDGGDALLGHPDLRGLSARLRAHRRRPGQCDAPLRHLRIPDRHQHRAPRRGCGDLPGDVPDALHHRRHAALVHPTRRGRVLESRAGSGAGMVEGGRWHKWVFFRVPLTVFVVGTLFPFYWMLVTAFRPDSELYRPWRAVNNTPFWTTQPTLEHVIYLFKHTMFGTWLYNTMFIAVISTLISIFCGLLAGYALSRLRFPLAGSIGTSIFVTYLVPPTLLFIPLANIVRDFKLGDTPWSLILTYPTFL